jgi:hypothetical protein
MQLKTIQLSAFDNIKAAVDAGKKVYLKTNPNYEVIKGKASYLVLCTLNNDCTGLHGNSAGDGLVYKTYDPSDFIIDSYYHVTIYMHVDGIIEFISSTMKANSPREAAEQAFIWQRRDTHEPEDIQQFLAGEHVDDYDSNYQISLGKITEITRDHYDFLLELEQNQGMYNLPDLEANPLL